MAIMDMQTRVTTGTNPGTIWRRDALVQTAVIQTIINQSTFPNYNEGMKAIGFSLEDEGASEIDHEVFMR